MKTQHINCGTFYATGGRTNMSDCELELNRLSCHCLLIESPVGVIAVDVGFSIFDLANPTQRLPKRFVRSGQLKSSPEESLQAQLFLLGIPHKDLTHICLTHMDIDHLAGLCDFPDATVHVNAAEFSAAAQPANASERSRYLPKFWSHNPIWAPHALSETDTWFGLPSAAPIPELASTLRIVALPGHTNNHCGIAVDCEGHWLLHAGDAFIRQCQLDHPEDHSPHLDTIESMICVDNEARLRTLATLQDLARNYDDAMTIFCSHDPLGIQELTER